MKHLLTPTVFFMSQADALAFNPETFGGNWLLIGITDPNPDGLIAPIDYPFSTKFVQIERMSFYDVKEDSGLNPTDVQRVHAAIDKATQNGWHIAIHCYMGSSRSGALAKYISSYSADYGMRDYLYHNETFFEQLNQLPAIHHAHAYRVYKHPRGARYRCDECRGLGCHQCDDGYRYTNE